MGSFPTTASEIQSRMDAIDTIQYGLSRNYLKGAVTRVSPYISRGCISTKQLAHHLLAKGYRPNQMQVFLKELAWRDYFQQVWVAKGEEIDHDLRQEQASCTHRQIPEAIYHGTTGIEVIDQGISDLQHSGYLHNHLRMYIAGITCNIGKSHWSMPAKWMYYYLLDADWGSNALSWQWVAGSFSHKKYIANQENINTYCASQQRGTFLDCSYEQLATIDTPKVLQSVCDVDLKTELPTADTLRINPHLPSYVYNFYNMDINWHASADANRILLLEPSFFAKYPVCRHTISFLLALSKNISGMQVFVGEFNQLRKELDPSPIHFKEHPTARHYQGREHQRDWLFEDVQGYFPSFSSYRKKCIPYLNKT